MLADEFLTKAVVLHSNQVNHVVLQMDKLLTVRETKIVFGNSFRSVNLKFVFKSNMIFCVSTIDRTVVDDLCNTKGEFAHLLHCCCSIYVLAERFYNLQACFNLHCHVLH